MPRSITPGIVVRPDADRNLVEICEIKKDGACVIITFEPDVADIIARNILNAGIDLRIPKA